jgi:Tfp pilus assembly protein PilN
MTMKVNLLPAGYVKRRKHHRRFRAAVIVGSFLLALELVVGIVVHGRAERTRELYAAGDLARQNSITTKKELDDPRHEAERMGREVHLAERLRTKHRWSRLMATLTRITPARVLLTSIGTNPPQWTIGLLAGNNVGSTPGAGKVTARRILSGVRLTGQAIDHQDLAALMAAIHATNTFASLDLKQARRERIGDHETINFELDCEW